MKFLIIDSENHGPVECDLENFTIEVRPRVTGTPADIGSMVLPLNGERLVGNTPPFKLDPGDLSDLNMPVGSYDLSAVAFSEPDGQGEALDRADVRFEVIGDPGAVPTGGMLQEDQRSEFNIEAAASTTAGSAAAAWPSRAISPSSMSRIASAPRPMLAP